MNKTTTGKLSVWLIDGPIQNKALKICSDLTADGERLLVLDAAACLDPSRISRMPPSAARNVHVLRISGAEELQAPFWGQVRHMQTQTQARRILLAGMLDHLYRCQSLTRDTARGLGRIKSALEELADSGLEIHVLCAGDSVNGLAGPGTRTYVVSSLCAAADDVHRLASAPQQYVDSASAAIA